jgi:stress response protein YsnF
MPEKKRAPRGETPRVAVVREHVTVERRARPIAVVRLRKRVEERTETIDTPLARHDVVVERVRINRFVDAPIPDRYEGDTLIVSVL